MILEKNNLQTAQEWTNLTSLAIIFDHRRLTRPGKKIRPNFLCLTSLLYKILPTNLGACKPTFYIIYTSHLRWNSTMRHCFYHTDLGQQNAVFHNIAIQIAIIQYSGRSQHAWALAKPLKKNFSKSSIRPAGSDFCSASRGECLNEH